MVGSSCDNNHHFLVLRSQCVDNWNRGFSSSKSTAHHIDADIAKTTPQTNHPPKQKAEIYIISIYLLSTYLASSFTGKKSRLQIGQQNSAGDDEIFLGGKIDI